ncbi:PRKCZ isoform 13 [Pan troglodytes]|uniref:PRKCZ isoform 13 n=1 Tax=Pan troglodytes TaxID=9598 RepID=A0A2J8K8J9_PANTR|nr:PRKCZ isoform 13 [Pan troglodytes]
MDLANHLFQVAGYPAAVDRVKSGSLYLFIYLGQQRELSLHGDCNFILIYLPPGSQKMEEAVLCQRPPLPSQAL